MRSTGMIAPGEFYWYFNNFSLLFAWEMKRANEKRILILISVFLGLKRAQPTTLTSVSESLSFFFFSLTFISNTCSISCCIFFSFNSRSSFSASSCSSGLLLNETLQKIKQGRVYWAVIALYVRRAFFLTDWRLNLKSCISDEHDRCDPPR